MQPLKRVFPWALAAGISWLACTKLVKYSVKHNKDGPSAPLSHLYRKQAADHIQAFVLAVNLHFPSEDAKQQFIDIWQPLAEYVKISEPTTLAFVLLEADTNPCHLMVYERYLSRDDYLSIHRASSAFLQFKAAMVQLPFEVKVEGQSFVEQNVGFML